MIHILQQKVQHKKHFDGYIYIEQFQWKKINNLLLKSLELQIYPNSGKLISKTFICKCDEINGNLT
jgi:hypothetical protein